jgi:hypothetical protein
MGLVYAAAWLGAHSDPGWQPHRKACVRQRIPHASSKVAAATVPPARAVRLRQDLRCVHVIKKRCLRVRRANVTRGLRINREVKSDSVPNRQSNTVEPPMPTWARLTTTDGNEIRINLDHVVTVRPYQKDRGGTGSEIAFAGGTPSSLVVREDQDHIACLRQDPTA